VKFSKSERNRIHPSSLNHFAPSDSSAMAQEACGPQKVHPNEKRLNIGAERCPVRSRAMAKKAGSQQSPIHAILTDDDRFSGGRRNKLWLD